MRRLAFPLVLAANVLPFLLGEDIVFMRQDILGYDPTPWEILPMFPLLALVVFLFPRWNSDNAATEWLWNHWPVWLVAGILLPTAVFFCRVDFLDGRIVERGAFGLKLDERNMEDAREIVLVVNRHERYEGSRYHRQFAGYSYSLSVRFLYGEFYYEMARMRPGALARLHQRLSGKVPVVARNSAYVRHYLSAHAGTADFGDLRVVREVFGVHGD